MGARTPEKMPAVNADAQDSAAWDGRPLRGAVRPLRVVPGLLVVSAGFSAVILGVESLHALAIADVTRNAVCLKKKHGFNLLALEEAHPRFLFLTGLDLDGNH